MDKVLVVTGGSRGIGAAVARHAAAEGWIVVLSFIAGNSEDASAVVGSIAAAGGAGLRGAGGQHVRGGRGASF
ncbi:MAG: SDR family NAD(P)-dependent oxidoreductase [Acetobacteraceae bacterium]